MEVLWREFLEWNIVERAGRQKLDVRKEWKGWCPRGAGFSRRGCLTPGARNRLHGGTSSKVHSTRDKHYRILKTNKQEKQIGDENENHYVFLLWPVRRSENFWGYIRGNKDTVAMSNWNTGKSPWKKRLWCWQVIQSINPRILLMSFFWLFFSLSLSSPLPPPPPPPLPTHIHTADHVLFTCSKHSRSYFRFESEKASYS